MRTGVFGGTFNPVHYGHLRAAEEARERLSLDRVFFVPAGNPPLKTRDLAPAQHRFAMTRLAVGRKRSFRVLDIESSRPGKSFTVTTLRKLGKMCSGDDLYFMVGIDAFLDIPNWWKPGELVSMTNFVVLSRPGTKFSDLAHSPYLRVSQAGLRRLDQGRAESLHAEIFNGGREVILLNITPMGISSTDIRGRVRDGLSLSYLLPETVESYIRKHRLYGRETPAV